MVGERTAICISRRLSSCRFCDGIAVFDRGQIVRRGAHGKPVGEDGLYLGAVERAGAVLRERLRDRRRLDDIPDANRAA